MLTSASLVVGLMAAPQVSAATPTFRAVGSAKQVYVTGLAASAQVSLLTPAGQILKTQRANALGGALFRNVPPAAGYQANNLEQERALSSFDVRPRMVRPASDQYFRARLGTGKAERSGNRGTLRISTD